MTMPSGAHNVEVIIQCDKWKKVPRIRQLAEEMVNAAIEYAGYGASKGYRFTLAVLLDDDKTVRALNHDFRGKNKPTNILSFPHFEGSVEEHLDNARQPEGFILGDMVLAFETVEREAKEQSKAIADHAAHLCLHGALHLLGFDHENDDEAAMMEDVEVRILSAYRIANPYM